MVLMALDHAALFIAGQHPSEMWSRPLPEYDSVLAFLTRYGTHLCAPGFLLLMGAGMVFFAESRRSAGWLQRRIIGHFALRGAVLILLQFLVVDPAWILPSLILQGGESGLGGSLVLYVGVLFALGGSMTLCALLVHLRPSAMLLAGGSAVLLSQLLVPPGGSEALSSYLARLLWLPGLTEPVYVNYPLLPWFGVACLGMALAKIQGRRRPFRRSLTLYPGLACLALFPAVRGLGGFGTFHPVAGEGLMAFLNVTKYPPSLAFLLMSLGGNLILLYIFSRASGLRDRAGRWLKDFGRSPLFFYVVHLYLYGFISLVHPANTSLIGMYPYWVIGLLILLPACQRYARFKAGTSPGSIWRLL